MWPQTDDGNFPEEVLVEIEVITPLEEDADEERVITDLDSHGSCGDDLSDYGSGSGKYIGTGRAGKTKYKSW